ncbi:7,8-dihydro-8-oxoguanine triphosphatase [Vallitalea longa]|uniref:7,8-dihydro-8-oxoguanine triphosphatase n=1 Tax=Vallitalea longa TaxID=2936439 RepID=A0A9W5YAU0_9FIRM|nr:8-oxo-dGTP diphosphatase [Vallitalea longa]GKX29096.1 7,8-dihydro-8-oxoguanine triphosphatase [Vallitalea longa]
MKLGTLCYIEKDGKTLMLHRVKKKNDIHEGNWIGLGGKIENGESPEECVIREIKEESGLTIKNPTLRGILTFPEFGKDDWYVFLYTVNDFEGQLIECDEGNLKWVNNEDVQKLKMSQGDNLFLEWLTKYKMFSAKFTYKDKKLIDYDLVVNY